jgi:hypothetical protein
LVEIPSQQNRDFFSTGCKPRHAKLPNMRVFGDLEGFDKPLIDLDTLAPDFQSLLDCKRSWGSQLHVQFRTGLGMAPDPCTVTAGKIKDLAYTLFVS